jgi:CRP/FNR family transcriptional regulator, nitrogen oxide reductase regulator
MKMLAASEAVALTKTLKPRFFEGLTPFEVASIIAPATKRRFRAHSIITHEGDAADHLFLTIHGRARSFCATSRGETVTLQWYPPGQIFGVTAFLSRRFNYLASTEALSNTTALVWDRGTIRSLSARFPRLVENALLVAYDYFVMFRSLHISATCHTAPQRLAQVLVDLATGLGVRVADGIELNIRNEELANMASITIFTASRLLNKWQREGLLMKTRGKIVLLSPEALMLSED